MSNLELLEDACMALSYSKRAMFGGHGLFAPNGGMFAAIIDEDRIMLKFATDPARAELVALGGAPWVYREGMTMKDWIVVPDAFYDEPATLAAWARRAHAMAPPKVVKGRKRMPATSKRAATKAPSKKPAAKAKKPAPKKPTAKRSSGATKRPAGKKR